MATSSGTRGRAVAYCHSKHAPDSCVGPEVAEKAGMCDAKVYTITGGVDAVLAFGADANNAGYSSTPTRVSRGNESGQGSSCCVEVGAYVRAKRCSANFDDRGLCWEIRLVFRRMVGLCR